MSCFYSCQTNTRLMGSTLHVGDHTRESGGQCLALMARSTPTCCGPHQGIRRPMPCSALTDKHWLGSTPTCCGPHQGIRRPRPCSELTDKQFLGYTIYTETCAQRWSYQWSAQWSYQWSYQWSAQWSYQWSDQWSRRTIYAAVKDGGVIGEVGEYR